LNQPEKFGILKGKIPNLEEAYLTRAAKN